MSVLLDRLDGFFTQEGSAPTYWLAFSGGLDSSVLLHLCARLKESHALKLHVLHINHQLQVDALQWEQFAAEQAKQYDLPFTSTRLQLTMTTNIEATARAARYAVFAEQLSEGDVLLTAHHAEDQAETVLLQLLRGSGLPGLSAMPFKTPFARGFHARPLLLETQDTLKAYANALQLTWVDDPSNQNTKFNRNYLRQTILPLLKARWPSFASTLGRSAGHCQEAQALLDNLAHDLILTLAGSKPNTLSLAGWKQLAPAKQRLVLRYWLQSHAIEVPEQSKLQTLQQQLQSSRLDKNPKLEWGDYSIERYRDDIFVLPKNPLQTEVLALPWDLQAPLTLPGRGVLTAQVAKGCGLKLSNVMVKTREQGLRVKLHGERTRELKTIFQALGVPPWQRAHLPLIFAGEVLACIPGFFKETKLLAKDHEEGFEFFWNSH